MYINYTKENKQELEILVAFMLAPLSLPTLSLLLAIPIYGFHGVDWHNVVCVYAEFFIISLFVGLLTVLFSGSTIFVKNVENKTQNLKIDTVTLSKYDDIKAKYPVGLSSAFQNVLSDSKVRISFEGIPDNTYEMAYNDCEALNGQAEVSYQEITTLLGKTIYVIQEVKAHI